MLCCHINFISPQFKARSSQLFKLFLHTHFGSSTTFQRLIPCFRFSCTLALRLCFLWLFTLIVFCGEEGEEAELFVLRS